MKLTIVFLSLSLAITGCGSSTSGTSDPGYIGHLLLDASPENAGWGIFSSALQHEGLADVRKLLREADGPYTVFSPSNAAFEAYFEARGITKKEFLASNEVAEIVRAHIAPGNYYPKTLFETDRLTFDNPRRRPFGYQQTGPRLLRQRCAHGWTCPRGSKEARRRRALLPSGCNGTVDRQRIKTF